MYTSGRFVSSVSVPMIKFKKGDKVIWSSSTRNKHKCGKKELKEGPFTVTDVNRTDLIKLKECTCNDQCLSPTEWAGL
ncbi:MAG TPA: hypothetical protein ENI23_00535 [bacterium]|nr:hypothetical protein [bacterium]